MSSPRLETYVFQQIENAFRLGEVLPDDFAWHIDMKRERLTFYSQGTKEIAMECPVQLVGSSATGDNTWLWAWANTGSGFSPSLLEAVHALKAATEGEPSGDIYAQPEPFPVPSDTFGREAAILCAGVSGGFCFYACGYDGGVLYTVIESAPRARDLPADPLRTIRAMTTGISLFALDHREAVRAYLGEPNADGIYASGVKVTFDAQGRIGEMNVVLEPPKKPSFFGRLLGR